MRDVSPRQDDVQAVLVPRAVAEVRSLETLCGCVGRLVGWREEQHDEHSAKKMSCATGRTYTQKGAQAQPPVTQTTPQQAKLLPTNTCQTNTHAPALPMVLQTKHQGALVLCQQAAKGGCHAVISPQGAHAPITTSSISVAALQDACAVCADEGGSCLWQEPVLRVGVVGSRCGGGQGR